jgi:hypothetical protein
MSKVTLRLPEVKSFRAEWPSRCLYCPGENFQRWGGEWRRDRDPLVPEVLVYRYRCCQCHRTFRHCPEGVDRGGQTQRMRVLEAIGWLLGMSNRGLCLYLSGFGSGWAE